MSGPKTYQRPFYTGLFSALFPPKKYSRPMSHKGPLSDPNCHWGLGLLLFLTVVLAQPNQCTESVIPLPSCNRNRPTRHRAHASWHVSRNRPLPPSTDETRRPRHSPPFHRRPRAVPVPTASSKTSHEAKPEQTARSPHCQSMRVAATRLSAAFPPRLLLLVLLLGSAIGAAMAGHVLGGAKENPAAANSAETDGLARFAVDEHNKRQVGGPRAFPPPPPFPVLDSILSPSDAP